MRIKYETIKTNSKLESRLLSGWKKLKKSINVSDLKISKDYLKKAYPNILYDNPEYFYVSSIRYNWQNSGNKILKVIPIYNISNKKKIAKMKKKIETSANKLLNGLDKNSSDYDKCLYVHDILAQQVSYKHLGLFEPVTIKKLGIESFNICGPLLKQTGVCQGYACTYTYLLKKVGVKSIIVTSKGMSHAWNKVKIGKRYYHVDVTHDDPSYDENGIVEVTSHDNFLLSDSQAAANGYFGWSMYGACNSNKKYTNKINPHKDALNSIFYINGYYYYIDKEYFLVARDKNGNKNKIYNINKFKTYEDNNYYWSRQNFPELLYVKGYLYFNDCDNVYKYNINSNVISTILSVPFNPTKQSDLGSDYISDLSVDAKNNLYYTTTKYISKNSSKYQIYVKNKI